ncbi:cysteine desulfurase family protein [Halalkalibacterium halodurans]|uniref:IscS subfamily cysteine desulfurase n=1 Tax=Halalkalibacterium halodurans TaxID=86665 RepID=UPI001068CB4B|nr:cysteine desulfurase family protein [Halalkalibacterium halodurans]MED3645571.1 cysteine desulfurase family protein [Halalkalibacterium halodurans]TES55560.1 cysteine desulfurase [Halalkalibacterium halodurans]
MIYLDYCATTPMSDYVKDVYVTVASQFYGNLNSLHDVGYEASNILEQCKRQIANLLHIDPAGIFFTGSASEANFLTIVSLALAHRRKGRHLITTKCEHPSVLSTFRYLESQQFDVSYVPVNSYGQVSVDALMETIREDTILVSIAHSQSVLGTIQSLETFAEPLVTYDILFHSDCTQSIGKVDVPIRLLHSLTMSGHKINGPKGIGLAYIDPAIQWEPFLSGVTQQSGFRQGTVDIPSVAAFTAAIEESFQHRTAYDQHITKLHHQFKEKMMEWPMILEGHPSNRLKHHFGLRLHGMEGQFVMLEANRAGFAISTGTACSSSHHEPDPVFAAIGRTKEEADQFFRVSFGISTTEQEFNAFIDFLQQLIDRKGEPM